MGIEADIKEIRLAGRASRDAAAITATIDLPRAINPLVTALPGSRVAAAIPQAGRGWHDELTSWRLDADAHGRDLIAGAERYEDDDRAAAADIAKLTAR